MDCAQPHSYSKPIFQVLLDARSTIPERGRATALLLGDYWELKLWTLLAYKLDATRSISTMFEMFFDGELFRVRS